jgi:radical SAM protein with 4Fe4S-binding SPASM domain
MQAIPRLVFWEVTKGCNLRCIHCRATATELSSPDDLSFGQALRVIDQIAAHYRPILVLSGGEPLFRGDIFHIARHAADRGLRVALATNGTLVTPEIALKIKNAGVLRVSISIDGADAATHDSFRAIPGAFEAALQGFRHLKAIGMSVQINTTVASHNVDQLPGILALARQIGADALHTFLLVPVGCGVEIADSMMVPAQRYEEILNWFYDQEQGGGIELKATCAPHYFRVYRQRRAHDNRVAQATSPVHPSHSEAAIGPLDTTMPGTTGIAIHHGRVDAGDPPAHAPHRGAASAYDRQAALGQPGHQGHPGGMHAMTKGCLAGTGVCFISHQGEVYPCGYLPVKAGDLRTQSFNQVWDNAQVFLELRDTANLKGKCGACEFRNICMGCRARAFAASGDHLAEEPFCVYEPKTLHHIDPAH